MNKLAYLLKLTQEELKLKLYDYLKKKEMIPVFEDGFLYAEGDIPVLVVAHMDTVFEAPPKRLFYDRKKDKIFNPDGGLGGDDRCGVYAILQLLEKFRPYVLFTEDEEIVCVGAEKTVKKLEKPNIKYIIEFDPKGKDDCVFYDCGNEEFMDYVESFGFKTDYGTCSDISILGSSWNIASVNLSIGYYHEHTEKEYVVFNQLQKTINRAKSMLKTLKKAPYFDYQEIQYTLHSYYPTYFPFVDELFDEYCDEFSGYKIYCEQPLITQQQVFVEDQESSQQDIPDKRLILKKDNRGDK